MSKFKQFFKDLGVWLTAIVTDFVRRAYIKNHSLYKHGLVAAGIAWLLKTLPFMVTFLESNPYGFLAAGMSFVFAVMVGLEIWEVSTMYKVQKTPKQEYGSWLAYAVDTFGDLTFGMLMAFFVLT